MITMDYVQENKEKLQKWFAQVAGAVDWLHKKKIIHKKINSKYFI